MAMLNKRALVIKANEPLVLETKPIHNTPPNGVVVKTHYAGICHSDVHYWEDKIEITASESKRLSADFQYPIVLGHEISGEVYSIGSEVTGGDLKVGDRVMCVTWIGCKECAVCKSGEDIECARGSRYTVGCSNTEGGYQEYVAVKSAYDVIKVPDNIPMELAALAGCSGLTSYNAVVQAKPAIEKALRVEGKATLLVIGCGGLGTWAIQLAKLMLPDTCRVICADISDEKVATGKAAGADDVIVWPLGAHEEKIQENTIKVCPEGFNAVIDLANNSKTIGRAFQFASTGAALCQVGLFGGTANTIPLAFIPFKLATIRGIKLGTRQQQRELLDIMVKNNIQLPQLTKVKLEEAFDYLMLLRDRKIRGRAVIDFINN